MQDSITLNKQGYDPFIDFLKGWAIISVVITHAITPSIHDATLFFLWGDWAIPIFLLIQVFHSYKKERHAIHYPWWKMIKRIVIPFAIITMVMFAIRCALCSNIDEIVDNLKKTILSGGIGPGCYYPWIYIQFFLLLPLLRKTLNTNILNGGGYLAVAILTEVVCSLIDMPEWFYRLFFIRYIFLIYLGYLWAEKGIEINKKTIFLSCISIVVITFFNFSDHNFEPLFFTSGWKIYHWICYFYPATLLVYFIKLLYDKLPQQVIKLTNICGKYSYEIFLWQMFVFTFIMAGIGKVERILSIPNTFYLLSIFNLAASILISVCIPLLYHRTKELLKLK